MALAEDVAKAIALLGGPEGDPVVDFLLDPGGAGRALDAVPDHGGLVIRVMPELGAGAGGHGPVPADPVWVRLMRGAREVGTAQFGGGDGMVRQAARVEVDEITEPCCDASGCEKKRIAASVWLVLAAAGGGADERLLVLEQRTGEAAPQVAHAVAARIGEMIGAPITRGGEPFAPGAGDLPAPISAGLRPDEIARFGMRTEGERVIVRDWDSRGPRASAARNAWIGAALMVVAIACWALLARSLGDDKGSGGAAIGAGIGAALFTLAGYAFLGVARFSAKYGARSAPMLAVGRDKLVVLPWVARDGAVDARPEGRLGAAIPLVEVKGAGTSPSAGGIAARLETDHGPFDVIICDREEVASAWAAAIERVIDEARHPRAGATARQRFRAKAQGAVA